MIFNRKKKARDPVEETQLRTVQTRLAALETRMALVEKQVHVIKRDA